MAIQHPKRFQEAAPAGFDGVFEWDFLKPAWRPTKIEPMDFDAVIERRMQFLVFETKDDGVPIKDGQRITLESLVRTGFFTVILLRGKTAAKISGWELWRSDRGKVCKEWIGGDSEALTRYCTRWFNWANNRGTAP